MHTDMPSHILHAAGVMQMPFTEIIIVDTNGTSGKFEQCDVILKLDITAGNTDVDGIAATDQLLGQEQSLLLEQDQEIAQAGVQTTTTTTRPVGRTTTTAPRTPTTTRVRPDAPDLPDLDTGEEADVVGLGAIGATFENPTRTLTEADELVTEIGEGFDGPR